MRELATDAAQEMLGVDGKLLATVRALMLRPGQLTTDYLGGRRVAFVGPVRVYLACSALLFAVLALQPPVLSTRPRRFVFYQVIAIEVSRDSAADAAALRDPHPSIGERIGLRVRAAVAAGPERHAQLEQRVTNTIPQAFFILVPAYAAALWLVAPRPRRHYPAHLCYALHVHAFAFSVLALALSVRGVVASARGASVGVVHSASYFSFITAAVSTICVAVLAYTLLAYRRVYAATWPGTVMRVVGSGMLYLALIAVALVALLVGVLLVG